MKSKKAQSGFLVVFVILLVIIGFVLIAGFDVVKAGHVGVTRTFEVVGDNTLQPGLHWTGLTTSVTQMSTRIQREDYNAGSASRDLQTVSTQVTVNYQLSPESAVEIYKTIGMNYKDVIIFPVVQEAVKSVTAQYTAEELITKRPAVKEEITTAVVNRVQARGLIVTEVTITDFEFSKLFNDAIEAKQSAEQQALQALNEKRRAVTQAEAIAESTKLKADADAYALRVVREQLEKSQDLVQYEAVRKWNGQLPQFYTSGEGSNMLFNLPVSAE